MKRSASLQVLALASYQLMTSMAQNNCSSSLSAFDDGFNATGSVSTPGFRVNDTYPESTWTWSQYISSDLDNGLNRTSIWTTLGLETSPVQNLSDPSLPYTACVIALDGFDLSNNGASDTGSCNSVFTSGCISEILAQVNLSASTISNTPAASRESFTCQDLLRTTSVTRGSQCDGQWSGSFAARFMPRNFSEYTPTCSPVVNPGASNATSRSFFAWSDSTSTAPDNYTIYDQKLKNVQPIIVAAFLKDEAEVSDSTPSWADTRLLCLPGNVTEPGSRNITEAIRTGGAARLGGSVALFGIVASTILVALL